MTKQNHQQPPPQGYLKNSSKLYNLFGKHLTECSFTSRTYVVLQIIQVLIILMYILLQQLYQKNSLKITLINIEDQVILKSMKVLFTLLFIISFLFLNTIIVIFIVSYFYEGNNIADKYFKRILNKSKILFKTAFFMPIFHFGLGILDFQELDGNVLWVIIGIISLIQTGILSIIFYLTPSKFNPYSQHPWIQNNQSNQIIKMTIKTIIVLCIQDGNVNQQLFYGIETSLLLVLTLSYLFYCKRFREEIKVVELYSIGILFWVFFSSFIFCFGIDLGLTQKVLFVLFGMFLFPTFLQKLSQELSMKYILQLDNNDLNDYNNRRLFQLGIIQSIKAIQGKSFQKYYIIHTIKCTTTTCVCKSIVNKLTNNQDISEQDYYKIIEHIIITKLNQLESSQTVQISILLAYIYLYKFKRPQSSIKILNKLKQEKEKMWFYNRFRIDVLEATILQKMQQSLTTQNCLKSQINQCYQNYKVISSFRSQLYKLSESIKFYWNNINMREYQVQAVFEIYNQIIKQSKQIKNQFDFVLQKCGYLTQIIFEYIYFRNKFMNQNIKDAISLYEDVSKNVNGEGKYLKMVDNLFLPNSKPGIISIFVNEHNFNLIHYMNHHILNKTHYLRNNIQGESFDRLLPQPFRSNFHDKLKIYSKQASQSGIDSSSERPEQRIQILDSKNNVFCSTMISSLINNITQQLLLICVLNLQESKQHQSLLYIKESGDIYGYSKRFQQMYGQQNEKNIKNIVKEIDLQELYKGQQQFKTLQLNEEGDDFFDNQKTIVYKLSIKLKQTFKIGDHNAYMLLVKNTQENQTIFSQEIHNIADKLIKSQSSINQNAILRQEESLELQSQKMNEQISDILFSDKQSKSITLLKVMGILLLLMCLSISVYNIFHFAKQIQTISEYSTMLLEITQTGDKIVQIALVCRRMNLQAYFRPDDATGYNYQKKAYDSILAQLNQQYYRLGDNILKLQQLGYRIDTSKMRSNYYSYPKPSELIQFYNSLTMYIQSISKINNITSSDLKFTPSRNITATNIPYYKVKLQQIIVNTYECILPLFKLFVPSVNTFWQGLISKYEIIGIVLFGMIVIFSIGVSIGVFVLDKYYLQKLEYIVNLTLQMKKQEISSIVSEIQEYQSTKLKEFYEADWQRTLLMFFAQEEKQEKQEQNNKSTFQLNVHSNLKKNSSRMNPKKKKSSRSSSRKTSSFQNQEKQPFKIKSSMRSLKHIFTFVVLIILIIFYFSVDFVLQRQYTGKMLGTTEQLFQILQRIRYIETLHLNTIQSVFQVQNWPDNKSLVADAKNISIQMFEQERLISNFQNIYDQWNQQIINLNTLNICGDYYYYGQNNIYPSEPGSCSRLNNGTLTKGLSPSLATFASIAQDFYLLPITSDTTMNQTAFIQKYIDFNSLHSFILSAAKSTVGKYNDVMDMKINEYSKRFEVKGIIFGVSSLILLFVWQYVINSLANLGHQIRGIMKIITFQRIKKNKAIKQKLVKDEIIVCLK